MRARQSSHELPTLVRAGWGGEAHLAALRSYEPVMEAGDGRQETLDDLSTVDLLTLSLAPGSHKGLMVEPASRKSNRCGARIAVWALQLSGFALP